jgi:HlyD family secretion protein
MTPASRILLAALAGASLLLASSCTRTAPQAVHPAAAVSVARAARTSLVISVEYPARVHAAREIVVGPKVAGRVSSVSRDVGQAVRAGDVLFTLEAADFEAQSRQAQAAVDSAQANLTRTSDSSLSSQVLQAQAAVQQAQVQYDTAKDLADRTDKLFNDGTASRQQRDNAAAQRDSAAIAMDTAKKNLALLQEKSGPQSTGLASTQVDQARAQSELAQSQLSNAIIRSPLTGVVASRSVDPGELVAAGTPAFVVMDTSSLTAEASLEESTVRSLHRGQSVTVHVDASGPEALTGIVETIAPAADARTQGWLVKVRVSAPPASVRPGMFARLSFPVDERPQALVVPNNAVVMESGVAYVWVVSGGAVKKTAVQVGVADDAVTEITSGLSDGASVVTEGQSFLNDGESVTAAP